ncbi:MAG: hypothetical protein M1616_05210 [Candidatus Thermoplasmatota archaeon]|jgi:hypothetical protein|nr:hypothetical protein [Candidatus Thermoplasmatota archaeon]
MADDIDLRKADDMIRKEIEGLSRDEPVEEIPVYTHHIFQILLEEFGKSDDGKEVFSLSDSTRYTMDFQFCEMKDSDGLVGEYEDLPSKEDLPRVETLVFEVEGMHRSKLTEIEVTKDTIFCSPAREKKHLMLLQRAILHRRLA